MLDPATLTSLLGPAPDHGRGAAGDGRRAGPRSGARHLRRPRGRRRARLRQRVASRSYGFDPTTAWLDREQARRSSASGAAPCPTAPATAPLLVDDSQLIQAVYQLPRARPAADRGPAGHHRRLHPDHRPDQLPDPASGSTGASSPGSRCRCSSWPSRARRSATARSSRGTDVVVNEVAIVHGAPDATEATAQVYFGIFSPTRATYRVDVPQGALLAAPDQRRSLRPGHDDPRHPPGNAAPEQPSAVRNLSVGTGSIAGRPGPAAR